MSIMTPQEFTFTAAAAGTDFTSNISHVGKFNYMVLETPNFTNTVTTKIRLVNARGIVMWDMTEVLSNGLAVTAQAKNTVTRYQFDFDIPIHRGWMLHATLSGAAGGTGGNIIATIAIEASK